MRRYALLDSNGQPVMIAEAQDLGDAALYAHRHGFAKAIPEEEAARAAAPATDRLAEGLRRLGLPAERTAADGWPRSLVREIAEARRPADDSAAVASTAGLPTVRVPRQEFTRVPPGGTTELTEVTPLGERLPTWKPAPRPTPRPSNGVREGELREPASPDRKLEEALRRLGVREAVAARAVGELGEGS